MRAKGRGSFGRALEPGLVSKFCRFFLEISVLTEHGMTGIDMIAAYAMKNFGESYTRRALLPSLEFDPAGPRGQFYPDVKAA